MKAFFLGVLLTAITSIAQADVLATAKNKAGGELILMTQQSNCAKGERVIIARDAGGGISRGCWFFSDDYVYATYDNGNQRMYDDTGWVISEKYKKPSKPKYEY